MIDKMLKRYLQTNSEKALERPPIEQAQLRGQPPSKISAVPGKSGSSGVFRDSRNLPAPVPSPSRDAEFQEEDQPYSVRTGGAQGYKDEWEERLNTVADEIQGARPSLRSKRTMAIRKSISPHFIPEGDRNNPKVADVPQLHSKLVRLSKRIE